MFKGKPISAFSALVAGMLMITLMATAFEGRAEGAGTVEAGWELQNNIMSNATFNAVQCEDMDLAWLFGDNGTILHTTDAGSFWSNQTSGTPMHILKVSYVDNKHIWFTAGTFGQISTSSVFATSDGGKNWTEQANAFMTAAQMPGICFSDLKNGWVVGDDFSKGLIIHTGDGGKTWKSQTSGINTGLNAVDFTDSSNGWAVGWMGKIVHTANSGVTWATQTSGIVDALQAVQFSNKFNGTAVGRGGKIIHTSDGGLIWEPQESGTTSNLWAVDFIDSMNGWVAGDSGTILHTSDGGLHWYRQASGTTVSIHDISMADFQHGWAVGAGSLILHTSNGGGADIPITPDLVMPAGMFGALFIISCIIVKSQKRGKDE